MPIEVPQGPGGADRGKTPVPGDPCYMCEVVGGRAEKGIVEEADLTLTVVNWKPSSSWAKCTSSRDATLRRCSTSRRRRLRR